MRPNLVSYENFAQKVGNFVDNCVRYVSIEQTYVGLEYAKWATASQRRPFSVISKGANFGYFSTEQIAVGYDDPIWAVAIETDRPECFKEWSVFDFEDDSKKDGNNLDISIKKKKKLLQFEPVELVVPRLEGAKKDS